MEPKKYYTISEIANILGIPTHRLRYLEKTFPKLGISRFKGRRYYTQSEIEFIRQNYNSSEKSIAHLNPTTKPDKEANKNATQNIHVNDINQDLILNQLNSLIYKFSSLAKNLEKAINM